MNHGFARKKAAAWIGALAIVVGFLVASVGQVHAKPSYLSSFNSTYGTSGTNLDTCNLCHPGGNTGQFTSYGNAYKNNNHSFASIESLDSDGDGFTNIVEITARTFPGDPGSAPAPTDTTPPKVNSTNPADRQTGVAVNADVTAAFSEAVKSVSGTTFTLKAGGTSVAGTVTLSGTT
ncbi:MAG: hypothetical protein H6R41_1799, partial [Deltaproteobacteria bacterium]|nr:hypothetical protein [Deltaproteobacteria bacterium]